MKNCGSKEAFFVALMLAFLSEWELVESVHRSFCIKLPGTQLDDAEYGAFKSVGVEKFPPSIWQKYKFKDDGEADRDWENNDKFNLQMELFPLRIEDDYAAQRNRGRKEPLSGWLRVELSLPLYKGFVGFIKSFVLFANDEQGNVVGHWEHDPFKRIQGFGGTSCPPSSATKHMVIPCGGTSKYEATPSNVILYARNCTVKHDPTLTEAQYKDPDGWPKQYKADWPIVPDYFGNSHPSFYFRYSVQPSNKNKGPDSFIIIRAILDVDETFKEDPVDDQGAFDKKLISVSAHFSIRPGAIPGGADFLPNDVSKLNCHEQIGTYDTKTREELKTKFNKKDEDFWQIGYSADDSEAFGWSREWLWFFYDFWGDQQLHREHTKDKLIFDFTMNTNLGCASKFYGGRCDGTICSLSSSNKAALDSIPKIKSDTKSKCSCKTPGANQLCFDEDRDAPRYFNNKDTTFESCNIHFENQFKSTPGNKITGGLAACPKNKADALNEAIKTIRWGKIKPFESHNGSDNDEEYIGAAKKKNRTLSEIRLELSRRGVRAFGIGTVLYAIRKGHGVLMLIMTFTCVPVASFVSRYMKESFMSSNILYAKVWFQVHLQLTFCSGALMSAGLCLALIGRAFLGSSLSPWALSHRVIGWTSCGVFASLLIFGGIRCYEDPCRWLTIFLHCGWGYFFYLLNIMSVWTSVRIPGSPSGTEDMSHPDYTDQVHIITMVLICWLVFEVIMQISMNVLLCIYDKWMAVVPHRKYIPPLFGVPIPVLKENLESDASGEGIRLVMFFVYVGFSIVASIISIFMLKRLNQSDPYNNEIGFGPMFCTHADLDTFYMDKYNQNFRNSCTTWGKPNKWYYRINF